MTLKKEKDSFNKLVQLLSEMVGQAISLSVVEPETKTADFVKNWLDNHYEEVGAAFGLSCCYGKGLDEAANEWVRPIMRIHDKAHEFLYTYLLDAFKAGAKWMAEQGWSRELEVKEDAGGYPYIDKHIELYDYDTDTPFAKKGDKVIVQIRKKEE